MKIKFKIIAIVLFFSQTIFAQQEAHYTQYMYNMSIVNPAYMTNELNVYQVGSLYRSQWVGIEGAPKTANIFAHIPVTNDIEFSLNFVNDKIGSNVNVNSTNFNIDLAYKINLNETTNLSFGLKSGISNFVIDASNSNVASDPLFTNTNKMNFIIGTGVFLFADNYYVGLSVPNVIPNSVKVDSGGSIYKATPHIFLTSGYVFDVSDYIKLKPSVMLKEITGVPLSIDVSLNALYDNRFELGFSYRYDESFSGLLAINVTPSLRVGYAYDYNTNDLKNYNTGSHEFILLYKFDFLNWSKKYNSY